MDTYELSEIVLELIGVIDVSLAPPNSLLEDGLEYIADSLRTLMKEDC